MKDITIEQALEIAEKYYPKDKYRHALRVMGYVLENEMIPNEVQTFCMELAIMHDLLEDTEYEGEELPEDFKKALKLLTKPEAMDYISYIRNIKVHQNKEYGKCAWWVKMADMKDHLFQRETLTEKLKNKYLDALPELL